MINRTVFQGRLSADPELKQTQSGVSRLDFTVIWSKTYNEVETKCFLRCKAWRGTADFIGKYFTKGQEIAVEGQLSTEEWADESGNKKSRTILTVDQAHFCGSKSSNAAQSAEATPATGKPAYSAKTDFIEIAPGDDLPF